MFIVLVIYVLGWLFPRHKNRRRPTDANPELLGTHTTKLGQFRKATTLGGPGTNPSFGNLGSHRNLKLGRFYFVRGAFLGKFRSNTFWLMLKP